MTNKLLNNKSFVFLCLTEDSGPEIYGDSWRSVCRGQGGLESDEY